MFMTIQHQHQSGRIYRAGPQVVKSENVSVTKISTSCFRFAFSQPKRPEVEGCARTLPGGYRSLISTLHRALKNKQKHN